MVGQNPLLSSAEFNVREITKQFLLLEDHLSNEEKFCVDCVRKHLMTVEALAEEAIALDPYSKHYLDAHRLAALSRELMVSFADGMDRFALSQKVRTERKKLLENAYDPRMKPSRSVRRGASKGRRTTARSAARRPTVRRPIAPRRVASRSRTVKRPVQKRARPIKRRR